MVNRPLFRFGFPLSIFLFAFISNSEAQAPVRNWGIRIGLNAVSITSYKAYQGDDILSNSSYTNKNGYLITGFARFNINRVFLQPEIAWNEYRRTCSFSLPVENTDNYYSSADLNIDSKAFNTDFLVGYNIVRDYPFLFGVYVGTNFIGTYRVNYSMKSEQAFSKNDWSLNYSGILGFSINISRIYFDLRYEMCLPNSDIFLSEIPNFAEYYQNVKIKRTESILSFSCGVMF